MHVAPRSRHARLLYEDGFSLAELLTGTALCLTFLGVVASFQQFEFTTLRNQAIQLNVQSTAQTVLDLFSRELRRACGISLAGADRIRFQADLNDDGRVDGLDEDVEYIYDSAAGTISRLSQLGSEVVSSGFDLEGTRLRYFLADGSELAAGTDLDQASLAAVRRVRIELALAHESLREPSTRFRAEVMGDVVLRGRFFMNNIAAGSCIPVGVERDQAWDENHAEGKKRVKSHR